MKRLLFTTSAIAMLSTAAVAQDNFDTLFFNTEVHFDDFRLSVNTIENSNPEIALGYYVWNLETDLSVQSLMFELGHTFRTDEYRLTAEYTIAAPINETFAVYASPSLNLVTDDAFDNTDVHFVPVLGLSAYISDSVVGYAEVSSTFDLGDSITQLDTIAEFGLDVSLSESLVVTPAITYNFDAPSNSRFQGGLTLSARF